MQTNRVLVVGDANADLVAPAPAFPTEGDDLPLDRLIWSSGGGAANAATALALLGLPVQLLARVGTDPSADVALRAASRAGVDFSLLQRDTDVATGLCYAIISPHGERTFLSFRGANTALAVPEHGLPADLGWLHIAGHALLSGCQRATALAMAEAAFAQGVPVSLDLCLPLVRQHPESTRDLLPRLAVLFGNLPEISALLPDPQEIPTSLLAVMKRGSEGCELSGKATGRVAGFRVEAVDTNACGDAFAAAFLWAMLAGHPPDECAWIGNAAGALTATQFGAAETLPTLEALQTFLARHTPTSERGVGGL